MSTRAAVALLAALLLAGAPARSAAAEDKPGAQQNPLAATKDILKRLEAAAALEKKDPALHLKSILALASSADPANDAEFLVEYAIRETDRSFRLAALWAARKADPKGVAEFVRKRAVATEKDTTKLSLAVDALGLLGGGEPDVKRLLELGAHPSELVATAAMRGLARIGQASDADEIMDVSLTHPSIGVSDQGAWAVQDLLKKTKVAIERYEKLGKSKSDPRAARAASTAAILKDGGIEPQKWSGTMLDEAVALLQKAPDTIEVVAISPENKAKGQAALDWMRDNMPGAWLLMRASVKRINVPGKDAESWVDTEKDELCMPLSFAQHGPHKVAFNLYRMSVILWQKRLGEPHRLARGWQPAIFDIYDLCVAAKLDSCGPSGVQREAYVRTALEKAPWSGYQ